MRASGLRFLCLCTLVLAAGCAHVQGHPPKTRVTMPTTVIIGDAELAKLNDEELFARGSSAFAANDYTQAARFFDRIVDVFPQSRHLRVAGYNAGLAHEKLDQFEEARERFLPLSDAAHGTGDALDATFRLAETDYHLGLFAEAIDLLKQVGARSDVSLNARLEAGVQQGICELESGQSDTAETTLRRVVDLYQNAPDREEAEDYFPAQAQFFLGEVYRLHFESVQLDPNSGTDKLTQDLELKAELLLSAQGHYLRSIRMGNGYWATAAGAQIGGLYENLYQHMAQSSAPKELNAEEAAVYKQELRRKIRILLTKAISVYENTLAAAERIGSSGAFVEKAKESLKKMKDLLLAQAQEDAEHPEATGSSSEDDDDGRDGPAPAPPSRHKARPGKDSRAHPGNAAAAVHERG